MCGKTRKEGMGIFANGENRLRWFDHIQRRPTETVVKRCDIVTVDGSVCCICLAKYANNDELRELPCSHFFHKECVDKWLKINALCPLCKAEVGDSI
ncbi:hypothetical protein CsSME_00044064 [Camellia sinensis var. sinensis]